jgi:hypothetical protein
MLTSERLTEATNIGFMIIHTVVDQDPEGRPNDTKASAALVRLLGGYPR